MYTNYQGYGEWDFRNEDTKEFTHCFHIYPAMMIPQVARGLAEPPLGCRGMKSKRWLVRLSLDNYVFQLHP